MDLTLMQVFILWIVGVGSISYYIKDTIARVFSQSKLPRIVAYYSIATPLILIEEFLTCETPFFTCIQTTLPAFYIFFLILFGIQIFFNLSYLRSSIIFGMLGWVNEFIFVGRIYELSIPHIVLFTILVIPIYAIVALIPSNYLQKTS